MPVVGGIQVGGGDRALVVERDDAEACVRVRAARATKACGSPARVKLQGMPWSAEGAGHMAALRAGLFNGRWEGRTNEFIAA